ncbi:serine/threonine-protein kinase PknE [Mycobacterium tuberculosis variant africanum]|nr:serine/threonine-protein kinase PknE [Mycobacterium tuberculosis variant africanum]
MDGTAESREGTQFGPYRLRRLVGRGGMGDVYEAEDTVRERIVALKLMSETLSSDPVFRTRMQREARTAGRLQEPHVVPIHDFGEIDGQLYVDMRLINGVDLAAMLRRQGPLAPPRAVAIVRQIGSALDAAHAAGATHRDVKPENILVSADDFAYLVDFGIASATTDEKLTQLGNTVGTLYYMAPERFSESHATYRADIYALTCVLYECLTGSPPYQGDQLSVMGAHINQAIPRPSTVRPGIPVAFDAVIARGMAKNPEDRYVTCGDLSAAAHAALATADQDRATDILRRSQVAKLPVPSTHPVSPGTRWPQPTPWAGGAPPWGHRRLRCPGQPASPGCGLVLPSPSWWRWRAAWVSRLPIRGGHLDPARRHRRHRRPQMRSSSAFSTTVSLWVARWRRQRSTFSTNPSVHPAAVSSGRMRAISIPRWPTSSWRCATTCSTSSTTSRTARTIRRERWPPRTV